MAYSIPHVRLPIHNDSVFDSLTNIKQFGNNYANLVSLGCGIAINKGQQRGTIDNLLLSPSGSIVVIASEQSHRIDYANTLRNWDANRLDAAIEDYFFYTEGQSMRAIDLMCRAGYLTYKDEAAFTENVNHNLKAANILTIVIGDGIYLGSKLIIDFHSEVIVCPVLAQ